MRRRIGVVTLLCAIAGAPAAGAATGPSTELIVGFGSHVPRPVRAAVLRAAGAQTLRSLDEIGYVLVRARPGAIAPGTHVTSVEPNLRGRIAFEAGTSPSDSCTGADCDGLPGQWHLKAINLPDAWAFGPPQASPVAKIAVLDTRVDRSHPDWTSAGSTGADRLDLAGATDLVPSSRWGGQAAYHGTFVAGLAGAATGNGAGGAAPGWNAKIMPVTVVDGGGATDAATLADGILHAWRAGARVINLSLGLSGDSSAVRDAISLVTQGDAQRPGSLVVAAAGNGGGSAPFYPGSYPQVLSVSGTDEADRAAPCSNHNANVSVSAPADRLVGLAPTPEYARRAPCGTSAAAPLVSGVAGALFAQDPSRTPAQVRALIESGADDLGPAGRDDRFGHGRLNAGRSLAAGAGRAGRANVEAVSAPVVAPGRTTEVTATIAGAQTSAARIRVGHAGAAWTAMERVHANAYRASVALPAGPGPHTAWLSVDDGSGWGPSRTAALLVDSKAPAISDARAEGGMRATGTPLTVRFDAADDLSPHLAIGAEFRSSVTGAVVARLSRHPVPAGTQALAWNAPLDAPAGHYLVKIAVADGAGNVAHTEIGAILT